MTNTRKRKDHRPAILRYLAKHGPARLAQIVGYLKASNVDAVEYDLRTLRKAGTIRSAGGLWRLGP